MKRIQLIVTLILLVTFNSNSQEKDKAKPWDVSNPIGDWNFKNLKLSTDEGTWMNLDVSPDGKHISFTSDAGGGDNIWVMNTDGSDAKQVTKENFRLLNNAIWTPDGDYLIARKHFTSGRSLGAGELWLYHKTGGSGLQLTKKKNDQQDVNEPTISPDGKYLYYSEDVYPGGVWKKTSFCKTYSY